jgi:hypothetical protein
VVGIICKSWPEKKKKRLRQEPFERNYKIQIERTKDF